MLSIRKPRAIKTIAIEKEIATYICYPRADQNIVDEGLFPVLTMCIFDEEYQARWHCICNPDMTYIVRNKTLIMNRGL